jgi:hypothetical protein
MTGNSKYDHANTPVGVKPNWQILSFIKGADSVYSFAVMTPKALSIESVNAPREGAELYNYGTEQS